MTGTIAIIFGILVIAAVVFLLVKQYETKMVLLGAGFLMAIVALKPMTAFNAFSTNMVAAGLIQNICSVLGFAFVMKYTKCDAHLIHFLAKFLTKVRFLLIPGAALTTFIVNISLTSAAGVAAAVGAVMIPLLISLGVAPAMAASAVMLGTFGSLLSPGLSHNPIIVKLMNEGMAAAGTEGQAATAVDVIKLFSTPSIVSFIIGAISLVIIAKIYKEDSGYVVPGSENVSSTTAFQVNYLYALLPLLPVIMLVIFAQPSVIAKIPWAKDIKVVHAMLIGSFLCFAATRSNPGKAVKEFFSGMGQGYGEIMGIIIAAGVFVGGMTALGLIEAFMSVLKSSENIASVAATYGPFALGVLSGSGDAAAIAFNGAVTPHAESLGFGIGQMGTLAALAGALGRTMSPIAGAAIMCAALANVNPFEIAKRNAPGMIIASVVSMIIMLYI